MSIDIAILDDHPLLIKGLQSMLGHHRDMHISATFQTAQQLLAGFEKELPQILLLDIQLQCTSGDELVPVLNKLYPELSILILTNLEHRYYIKSLMPFDIKGYVLKSSDEDVLLEALRTIHLGGTYFDPSIQLQVMKAHDRYKASPSLTRREKEILKLIATDSSSQQIADGLCLSKRTVENHRTHLLQKLDVKNAASLVKKAIELGLM
ncbi:MAG: response regulator transcription factor [Sphingobacteriales bacterium]|nr:MAG: response regulator transcription factor [Sphingobacteriales bacterium]